MRAFQMDAGLRRVPLHCFVQRCAENETVQQHGQLPFLFHRYPPPCDLAGHRISQFGEAHITRQFQQRQSQPVSDLRQF